MIEKDELLLRPRNIRVPRIVHFSFELLAAVSETSKPNLVISSIESWLSTDLPARKIIAGANSEQLNLQITEDLDSQMRIRAAMGNVSVNAAYVTATVDWLKGPEGIVNRLPELVGLVASIPDELEI